MTADTSLVEYLNIAWRRKYWLLAPVLLGLVISLVALKFLPRIYMARAGVMQQPDTELNREFLRPLINPYQALNPRELNEKVKTTEFLQGLARRMYELPEDQPVDGARVFKLREAFDVSVWGNFIYFTAFQRDPVFAASVVNEAAEHFVGSVGTVKRRRSTEATEFFSRQFEERKLELEEKEAEIARFKASRRGSLPEDSALNQTQLTTVRGELMRVQGEIQVREQERADLLARARHAAAQPASPGLPAGPTELDALHTGLARLEGELDQLLLTKTPRHPDVIAKKDQIKKQKRRIEEMLDAMARSPLEPEDDEAPAIPVTIDAATRLQVEAIDRQIAGLRTRERQLAGEASVLQSRVFESRQIDADLQRLQRERDAIASDYSRLLSSKQGADLSQEYIETGQPNQFSFELRAGVPREPVSPNAFSVLGLGLALGLGVGIGLVVLMEVLDQSFRYPEEIQAQFDVPVIATIMRIDPPGKPRARRRAAARARAAG